MIVAPESMSSSRFSNVGQGRGKGLDHHLLASRHRIHTSPSPPRAAKRRPFFSMYILEPFLLPNSQSPVDQKDDRWRLQEAAAERPYKRSLLIMIRTE